MKFCNLFYNRICDFRSIFKELSLFSFYSAIGSTCSMGDKKKQDIQFLLNSPDIKTQKKTPSRPPPLASSSASASASGAGSSSSHAHASSSSAPTSAVHKCPKCDKVFSIVGNLNKHMAAVHDKKKAHKCDYCPASFAFRDGLNRHVSTVHLNQRRYTCGECQRKFKHEWHLNKHMRTIHKKNH